MDDNSTRNAILIFAMSGSISVIIIDLILLIVLIKNRQRHPGYYIIANLSLADIMTMVTIYPIIIFLTENNWLSEESIVFKFIMTFSHCTYLTSLLAVLFLSIDRFVAVKYCLRYHAIVNEKFILLGIFCCWIFPLPTISILWINAVSIHEYVNRALAFITTIRIILGSDLLAVSIYTNIVRKKHIASILKTDNHFGVLKEKLDILKHLKSNLKQIFKFNVVTIVMLSIQISIEIVCSYTSLEPKNAARLQIPLVVLLKLSNSVAIMLTQKEIRDKVTSSLGFRILQG